MAAIAYIFRPRVYPTALVYLAVTCCAMHTCGGELTRTPIIVDTDIGTDIDDAFALALVVASPELDLRGVTTVSADAYTRAMIACRFLDAVGRADVPVASGRPRRAAPAIQGQYQYGLRPARKRPESRDAVDFVRQQLNASSDKLTIITLGDLTNIGRLIAQYPGCTSKIARIVIMGGAVRVGYNNRPPPIPEWNIKSDVHAAQVVFTSGVPIVVAPLDATTMLKLDAPLRRTVFAADTPLTRQLVTLYDLWGKKTPVLFDPVAVTLGFTERFFEMEELRLEVDDRGLTREVPGKANARVATAIRAEEFLQWYVDRIVGHPLVIRLSSDGAIWIDGEQVSTDNVARRLERMARRHADVNAEIRAQPGAAPDLVANTVRLCRDAGIRRLVVSPNHGSPAFGNVTSPVDRGGKPIRLHVAEDYETDIESRWWLAGRLETENVPPSLAGSLGNRRVSRATKTRNFDGKMGDQSLMYEAVIFNPVPGPPMGAKTRLSFRYYLSGTDRMRVQIYSLTKGYHRYLSLTGLAQGQWQLATVDMTQARRPDGSGGRLAEDERIDDIQFYIEPMGELLIDDILLYEPAGDDEARPFPARIIFNGWFDTGRQGVEWPGQFEIVPHAKPLKWKAARSVIHAPTGRPWIRIDVRGHRPLGGRTAVSFRYWLTGRSDVRVVLTDGKTGRFLEGKFENPKPNRWAAADLILSPRNRAEAPPRSADELRFLVDAGCRLLIDDVLVYEPARR